MIHVLKYFKMWKFEVLKIFRDDFKKSYEQYPGHNLHCCMQNRTHTWSMDSFGYRPDHYEGVKKVGFDAAGGKPECEGTTLSCIIMIYYITVVIRLLCNIIDCTAHYVYTLFYYYIIGQGEYIVLTFYEKEGDRLS